MLASIFVAGGLDALRHPAPKAALVEPQLKELAVRMGLPDDPELLVRANGAAQMAAGLMLATGRLPRLGGAVLVASLVPTTYLGHRFWEKKDPTERSQQRTQFLKNMGLVGGLLLAVVDTEGKPGLVWRAQNAGRVTRREARHAARSARREAKLRVREAKDVLS